jgi:hypothetical protein
MEIVKWKIMAANGAGRVLRSIWTHISLYDAVDLDGGAMLYKIQGSRMYLQSSKVAHADRTTCVLILELTEHYDGFSENFSPRRFHFGFAARNFY